MHEQANTVTLLQLPLSVSRTITPVVFFADAMAIRSNNSMAYIPSLGYNLRLLATESYREPFGSSIGLLTCTRSNFYRVGAECVADRPQG